MRDGLARWAGAELGGDGRLRLVGVEALHVTLVFLGSTPLGAVDRVWAASSDAVQGMGAPVFGGGGVVGVPRGRPRLLALELEDEDGRAARMQDALVASLAAEGLAEPEERPFWPHVTLARARRGARLRVPEDGPSVGRFAARELTLYRSVTAPTGARYEVLRRVGVG